MAWDHQIGRVRWWPGTNTVLPDELRASQAAVSTRWRKWAGSFAESIGLGAAAAPIFAEAVKDGAKVARDLFNDFQYYAHKSAQKDYSMYPPQTPGPSSSGYINNGILSRHKRARANDEAPGRNGNINDGGSIQYTKRSRRFGKKAPRRKRIAKLLRSELSPAVIRFQGVNVFSGTQGYFKLWNQKSATTNLVYTLPVHLYDITSTINQAVGIVRTTNPGFYPAIDQGAIPDQMQWVPIRGSTIAGNDNSATTWDWEKKATRGGTAAANTLYEEEKGLLDWVDIRLILYSMSATATKFEIALVQFEDEMYCPGGRNPSMAIINDASCGPSYKVLVQEPDAINWWQEFMRPWCYSPIMPSNTHYKGIKFLKREQFMIHPKDTTNGDTNTPSCMEYRMFYNANRLCRYNWLDDSAPVAIETLQNDGWRDQTLDINNRAFVHPKARIYLMIRANCLAETASDTPKSPEDAATANAASYDMIIRARHTLME